MESTDPKLTTELTHADRQRIYKEVVLRVDPSKEDSTEEAEWRERMEAQVADIRKKGLTPDTIWDSSDPDD